MTLEFQSAVLLYMIFTALHLLVVNLFFLTRILAPAAFLWAFVTAAGGAYLCSGMSLCGFFATTAYSFSLFCLHCLVLVASRNSVTLSIMDEIDRAGVIRFEQIDKKFTDNDSVRARLVTMERSGFFSRAEGELRLSPKGILLGRLALVLRRLFSLERAG